MAATPERTSFRQTLSHFSTHVILVVAATAVGVIYRVLENHATAQVPVPAPMVIASEDGPAVAGIEACDSTGEPRLRTDRNGIFCDEDGEPCAPASWGLAGTVLRIYFKGRVWSVEVTTDERGNPEPIVLDALTRPAGSKVELPAVRTVADPPPTVHPKPGDPGGAASAPSAEQ